MHKQPAYLYQNIQTLYANLAPIPTRFRKMYARPLKLYKGIENEFTLRLLNNDQKPLSVVGQTVVWQMIDPETTELKLKKTKQVEGADNASIKFIITENDLAPLEGKYYTYNAYLLSDQGKQQILYGDAQQGAAVTVEIVENAFPQIYPSVEITDFTTSDIINYQDPDLSSYSSAIDARPDLNRSNTALHTAVFYSDNFNGTVDIEVSLESAITGVTVWSILDTVIVTNSQAIAYKNFNGIYNWVRFRIRPSETNTGKIDKILYRS